jgi:hypothetical protein
MKIRPVGAELFHADGQTDRLDMMELMVAFRSLGTRLKTQTVDEVHSSRSNLNTLKQGSKCVLQCRHCASVHTVFLVCVAVPSLCVCPHSVPCVCYSAVTVRLSTQCSLCVLQCRHFASVHTV